MGAATSAVLRLSQTRKLEQRVDGFQMLSAETFVYRKVLHTGQAVPVSNLGKGGL